MGGTKITIPTDEWQEWLKSFSSGNRGRKSAIATYDITIAEDNIFSKIEYDPLGKDFDMMITLEGPYDTYSHIILDPAEISITDKPGGEFSILEIINQNEECTCLVLSGRIPVI